MERLLRCYNLHPKNVISALQSGGGKLSGILKNTYQNVSPVLTCSALNILYIKKFLTEKSLTMADLKEFAEQLVNLTVKEVNELADILKDEYGIEPAAAAVAVAGPAAGGADGEAAEEQSQNLTLSLKVSWWLQN